MTSLDVQLAQLKFIELPGYRMAYREWGDTAATDAVVLVHGITSSSLSWIRVAPALATVRPRVIAVDLKGHGDSQHPPTGYRIADQADEVAGLCKALGLQNISLLGHSWGGAIALELVSRGDPPIDRLVLEDPLVALATSTAAQAAERARISDGFASSVGLTWAQAEALARPNSALGWTEQDIEGKMDAAMKGDPAAVRAVFAENDRLDLTQRFAELRCPTLLLRAHVSRGGIVGHEAVAVASANPRARVVTVENADHSIHRGQFDAFMAEVRPFLRD